MADADEREEELETLKAIFPELIINPKDRFTATLDLAVAPSKPLYMRFVPTTAAPLATKIYSLGPPTPPAPAPAYIEHDVAFTNLPPLTLQVTLPATYPAEAPPIVMLSTAQSWLPASKISELQAEATNLWTEYGHCQILFAYVDYLQAAAESGFDLDQTEQTGCLVLPVSAEAALVAFDAATTLSLFNAGTYDCGICLEPKKGSSCFKLARCGHVFCKSCLQDFYNNAITEGDVSNIRCLDPNCGKDAPGGKRKRRSERTLHPRDLLAIGVEEAMVRRYVELKRKKRLETDKSTVYCPRTWCQGAARSAKYPPLPADLAAYDMAETSSESEGEAESAGPQAEKDCSKEPPGDPSDRLAVCEKCELAFCKVCFMGWHGPFARCFPRDPNELSKEEQASYDYIRKNTSPCPTCGSPTQKTMGCNHMRCFQCNTHFCYLCGAWLDGQNPYQHFNKLGSECYQRLWELEEGDEGQGPEDGRGFAGGRGWEQMAIDVAREADEREAAEAAERANNWHVPAQAAPPNAAAVAALPPAEIGRRAPDALDAPDAPMGGHDDDELDELNRQLDHQLAELGVERQNLLARLEALEIEDEVPAQRPPAVRAQPRQPQQRPPHRTRQQQNLHPAPPPREAGAAGRAQAIRDYERNHQPVRGGIRGLNARRPAVRVAGDDEDVDWRDHERDGEDARGNFVLADGGNGRRVRVHQWHPLF